MTDYTSRGYYSRTVHTIDADDNPVKIEVNASPTDDPRVMLDLAGTTGRDGYPLIEILTLEPNQVDAMIEALASARDYLRSHAGQHQRSAPIVVANSVGHVLEYKFDCACGWGSAWHVTEELARQEHGQHAAAEMAGV